VLFRSLIAEKREDLQKLVKTTVEFFNYFGMKFNPTKSAFSHNIHATRPVQIIKLGTETPTFLAPNELYRYLGFDFKLNLDWTEQQDRVIKSWKRALTTIMPKRVGTDMKIHAINPILSYSMNIIKFNDKTLKELDKTLCEAIFRDIGVPRNTNYGVLTGPRCKGGRGLTLPSDLNDITLVNTATNLTINRDIPTIASKVLLERTWSCHLACARNSIPLHLHNIMTNKYNFNWRWGWRVNQYRQVECIGKSFTLPWKHEHQKGFKHRDPKTGTVETWAWTDGSQTKIRGQEKAGVGIYLGGDNGGYACPSDGDETTAYCELKAIELVLDTYKDTNLRIWVDAKTAIDSVENWNYKGNSERKRCKHKEIMKRISYLRYKNYISKGHYVVLAYVPSHFEQKLSNPKQNIAASKWKRETILTYGPDMTENILKGNERADKLAKEGTNIKSKNSYPIPNQCDMLIFEKNNEYIKGSPHTHLKKEITERHGKKWKKQENILTRTTTTEGIARKRYNEYLSFPQIHPKADMEGNWLANFATKLRLDKLKTRKWCHLLKPKENSPQNYVDNYKDKYESPNCTFCNKKEDESNGHFLTRCPRWRRNRKNIESNLSRGIRQLTKSKLDIPCWIFNPTKAAATIEERYPSTPSELLQELAESEILAIRRLYFPNAILKIIQHIESTQGNPHWNPPMKELRELMRQTMEEMRTWYNERCKLFHEERKQNKKRAEREKETRDELQSRNFTNISRMSNGWRACHIPLEMRCSHTLRF